VPGSPENPGNGGGNGNENPGNGGGNGGGNGNENPGNPGNGGGNENPGNGGGNGNETPKPSVLKPEAPRSVALADRGVVVTNSTGSTEVTVRVSTVPVTVAPLGATGTNVGLNVQTAATAASDDPGQAWLGGLVLMGLTGAALVTGRNVERKRNLNA
jgi:hypothetical protein